MLKIFYTIAIVASIALLSSLAAISYLSSPPSSNSSEQRSNTKTEKEHHAEEAHSISGFIRYLFPDGIAVFTFWLVIATIALGVGAVVQIGYLERAEGIAEKSSQAAKDAADVASKTLVATQRPWIYPDVSIGSDLVLNDDGAKITFEYVLKNSGNTPAINVEVHPRFFAFQFGKVNRTSPDKVIFEIPQTDPAAELIKLCDEQTKESEAMANGNWLNGDPVFPGRDLNGAVTITIPKPEIDAARAQSAYKSLIPVLLFCVTYRFPFDTKSHHTGLIFQLYRRDANSAGGRREFNTTDSLVPRGELALIPNPFRSGTAD